MTNVISFPALGLEFAVNPLAFSIGNVHIYWYGIIIALAFGLALLYCIPRAKLLGLHSDRVIDVVIGGTIGGIVGARLYYVIFAWDEFAGDLPRIFMTWTGGMAIYGGIIGALVVGLLVAKWRHVKAMPMLDLAASGFLIGQGIGRWGNFINQEAFGSNTTLPWGMTSQRIVSYLTEKSGELAELGVTVDPDMPVHPCFLYESIWCLLGVLLLHLYCKHRKFDGELFFLYIGWYGLGRTVIEGLRTDSLMLGTLRVSQLLAAFCVIASVAFIVSRRIKIRNSGDPTLSTLYMDTEESKAILAGAWGKDKPREDAADQQEAPVLATAPDGDEPAQVEDAPQEEGGEESGEVDSPQEESADDTGLSDEK